MHENDDSQFFVIYHFELHTTLFDIFTVTISLLLESWQALEERSLFWKNVWMCLLKWWSGTLISVTMIYQSIYNNNEKKFLSPTSNNKDDSNQVFCENEHSVHKFRDAYFSQSPKITPFHEKVTLLKPDQKNFSIYGDDLLPNHLNR